jgi:hypothetical protein
MCFSFEASLVSYIIAIILYIPIWHRNIKNGNIGFHNSTDNMTYPIEINNAHQMKALGIDDANVRILRAQLNRGQQTKRIVPEGYEHKYCAMFFGRVFHSFDTKEQLEEFRKGPKNVELTYTFYYTE